MELTLRVNNSLARKIQGLSVLTGKTADDITSDLSTYIEGHITQQLILAVGIKPEDLTVGPINRSGYVQNLDHVTEHSDSVITVTNFDDQSTNDALIFPDPKEEEEEEEDEDESYANGMATGLGAPEEEFDKFDDELPDSMVEKLDRADVPKEDEQELVLPGEEQEEEIMMPVKDKDGNNSGYADPIMADLQDELDSGDLDGMADYDFEDDEDFVEEAPRKVKVSGHIPSDAPAAEGYENVAPDVLPVDYGIDKVSSLDGRANGSVDFFENAFAGAEGDKTARNTVKRKRIITDF